MKARSQLTSVNKYTSTIYIHKYLLSVFMQERRDGPCSHGAYSVMAPTFDEIYQPQQVHGFVCQQHCKKQIFHIIHHCYSEIVNKTIIFEVCSHSDDMVQNVQQM